jgi:AraC-like DNA-binding protein
MNPAASISTPGKRAPSSRGVLSGREPAVSFCSTARGQSTSTALTFEESQHLLRQRLTRPLLDLFHQFTDLRFHLSWHNGAAELSSSALAKLCPQAQEARAIELTSSCQECLAKRWLPEWTHLRSEKQFPGLCGTINYYACLKVRAQPVVTLLVQQPKPAPSQAAMPTFPRAISLTRLILHDLKATLEARRAAVELESLHRELAAAGSSGDAAAPGEPNTALGKMRRNDTLIQKPEARGQRPKTDQTPPPPSPPAPPGHAPAGDGAGLNELHTHPLNGNHREQLVQRMLDYIHQHYARPIQLHDLAAAMDLNASYVSALFSSTLGVTFHHYLEELRLARAQDFLRDPVKRVSEVAYAVGYSSPKHFRYAFTTRLGLPPSAWRQAQPSRPAAHAVA